MESAERSPNETSVEALASRMVTLVAIVPAIGCTLVAFLTAAAFVNDVFAGLGRLVSVAEFTPHVRTRRVLTFALCGFANVSSLGVAFGVISTIAPNRSTDLASIGFSALVAGCVANYLTACTIGKYNHDTEILPRNFTHSDCMLTCGITDRYTGQQFRRKQDVK
ncbi:hypothetical protein HPB48_015933 [Haemaphysalis longicornis]|uniref:Concentrative nucleoside transporter C-terminal domain-containing protein n=1 Tax=Haemaphysalis longicornis TaxID=44386 RepID=A0A9J6G1I4_HAELO|nr:hypothetical protein HPB48_015933 [Haemaphysalis longicornis]